MENGVPMQPTDAAPERPIQWTAAEELLKLLEEVFHTTPTEKVDRVHRNMRPVTMSPKAFYSVWEGDHIAAKPHFVGGDDKFHMLAKALGCIGGGPVMAEYAAVFTRYKEGKNPGELEIPGLIKLCETHYQNTMTDAVRESGQQFAFSFRPGQDKGISGAAGRVDTKGGSLTPAKQRSHGATDQHCSKHPHSTSHDDAHCWVLHPELKPPNTEKRHVHAISTAAGGANLRATQFHDKAAAVRLHDNESIQSENARLTRRLQQAEAALRSQQGYSQQGYGPPPSAYQGNYKGNNFDPNYNNRGGPGRGGYSKGGGYGQQQGGRGQPRRDPSQPGQPNNAATKAATAAIRGTPSQEPVTIDHGNSNLNPREYDISHYRYEVPRMEYDPDYSMDENGAYGRTLAIRSRPTTQAAPASMMKTTWAAVETAHASVGAVLYLPVPYQRKSTTPTEDAAPWGPLHWHPPMARPGTLAGVTWRQVASTAATPATAHPDLKTYRGARSTQYEIQRKGRQLLMHATGHTATEVDSVWYDTCSEVCIMNKDLADSLHYPTENGDIHLEFADGEGSAIQNGQPIQRIKEGLHITLNEGDPLTRMDITVPCYVLKTTSPFGLLLGHPFMHDA